jgi:hypothetical protein
MTNILPMFVLMSPNSHLFGLMHLITYYRPFLPKREPRDLVMLGLH